MSDKTPQPLIVNPAAHPQRQPGDAVVSTVGVPIRHYHYVFDGFDDRGWGCAYRTGQTIFAWLGESKKESSVEALDLVPSIRRMQEMLVALGDKKRGFAGSREWIGSVELSLLADHLYPRTAACRIQHLADGAEARGPAFLQTLRSHFHAGGGPIMAGGPGGGAIGILGCRSGDGETATELLVLDPHYVGPSRLELVQRKPWFYWAKSTDVFSSGRFYNMLLAATTPPNKKDSGREGAAAAAAAEGGNDASEWTFEVTAAGFGR